MSVRDMRSWRPALSIVSVMMFGAWASPVSPASAAEVSRMTSGIECHEVNAGSSTIYIGFNQYGAHNVSAISQRSAICPYAVSNEHDTLTIVGATLYDRSSTDEVLVTWCWRNDEGIAITTCEVQGSGVSFNDSESLQMYTSFGTPFPTFENGLSFMTVLVRLPAQVSGNVSALTSYTFVTGDL